MKTESTTNRRIIQLDYSGTSVREETLAAESPLEIRLSCFEGTNYLEKPVSITMRTPGDDINLALGFLFTEGIVKDFKEIKSMQQSSTESVVITLHENVKPDTELHQRNFTINASCGICGKTSLEQISKPSAYSATGESILVSPETLFNLQNEIHAHQDLFIKTGGIHASALFTANGRLLHICEDIGRHNALDKLIGTALRNEMLPLDQYILLLSGRAGFELIQKASMAGMRFIAAIGAPTDLAVEYAESNDITLVGFLRQNRMNIYTGKHRIHFNLIPAK